MNSISNINRILRLLIEELSASEALYAFAGGLTTRKERTVMSSSDDAAPVAELVDKFCKANSLSEPRPGWEKNFVPLSKEEAVPEPPQELIDAFEKRTNDHIRRVIESSMKILGSGILGNKGYELVKRCVEHDASKWSPEEFIPYVWLTYYYKIGKRNEVPEPLKSQIDKATEHHVNSNFHHPEYWKNAVPAEGSKWEGLREMTTLDLAEMCCDFSAMSKELGNNLRSWVEENTFKKHKFTKEQKDLIMDLISILE